MHFTHLTTHQIMDIPAYWILFWNTLYVLCPPREYFNSKAYNRVLDLISYYGSLNVRSLIMKAYGASPNGAPPTNPNGTPQPPAGN